MDSSNLKMKLELLKEYERRKEEEDDEKRDFRSVYGLVTGTRWLRGHCWNLLPSAFKSIGIDGQFILGDLKKELQ